MDVNGTRFHLVREEEEWRDGVQDANAVAWEGDALILAPRIYRFEAPPTPSDDDRTLVPEARRGAAADRHGTIYFLDRSRKTVLRRAPGGETRSWWTPELEDTPSGESGVATATGSPAFRPAAPEGSPEPVLLRGLTVTGNGWLLVGHPAGAAILAVDLEAGGPSLRLPWPADVDFDPWSLEAAPEDGAWILDRTHRRYWLLDRTFGVVPAEDEAPPLPPPPRIRPTGRSGPFRTGDGTQGPGRRPIFPTGLELTEVDDPVALASLPDGTVLVLDSPPAAARSAIHRFRGAERIDSWILEDVIPLAGADEGDRADLHAFDLAFVRASEGEAGWLVLVESGGNQAFRWRFDPAVHLVDGVRPDPPREYLPLRRYGGGELVVREEGVLYDFRTRWVEIRPAGRIRYRRSAELRWVFDGGEEGCAWHRLALDACVPDGCRVRVWARADDERSGLEVREWLGHPVYLRNDGSELPFHARWRTGRKPGEGTWETLFQSVEGRWLELSLELEGPGPRTPVMRALRVHFPRFSYLHEYMPEIWREEPGSTSFTDRWLANFEGLFTTWEGRIVQIRRLFDTRAAPSEGLDWLAGWLGVVLDPLWTERQRRLFLRHAARLHRWRGTTRGVEAMVGLYLDPEPDDTLFEAPPPDPLCPRPAVPGRVRVVEAFRVRRVGPAVAGLTADDPGGEDLLVPLTNDLVREHAHRFTVLVPAGLDAVELAMVRRIVELAKPAHTAFSLEPAWSLFRVGGARVGLDTELGSGPRFAPAVLGTEPLLGTAHVAADPPFDHPGRIVPERDRFGLGPPL